MPEIEARAIEAFRRFLHAEPWVVSSAPGRINLIGEHTDYNDGFVLPCAIEQRIAVAIGPGNGRLYSLDLDDLRLLGRRDHSWADYPRGVAWAIGTIYELLPAFALAATGDVPRGAGLSSSAALEAATALALDEMNGLHIERRELAVLCRRAENAFVGVASGIMDQYAALLCRPDAALLIDCRTLEARTVPLRLGEAGLTLLVCDTRVERRLAASGYNDRRAACERAAKRIGLPTLRDATLADLDVLEGDDRRRARHVITENARVLDAVRCLEDGDFGSFGRLMSESHASLRDDYGVSTPELDLAVVAAREAGALGARLTGAGFGGSIIALVPGDRVGAIGEHIIATFRRHQYADPAWFTERPSKGASASRL